MLQSGQFSEGTKRLLQRHAALPPARTRELAAAFLLAQAEVCRGLATLGYPMERLALELRSGHMPFFREGSDRDRKRSLVKKASYRFAGFAPSHLEEFERKREERAGGRIGAEALIEWQAQFLLGFTFEVIEQVARRAHPAPAGRLADSGIEEALGRARRLRDEILQGNLLLAAKVVIGRGRHCSGVVWDELFAAGADGLMIAIHRYDPAIGHFSTYAMPWVRMAIDRFVAKTRCVIRVPIGMQEKVRRQRRSQGEAQGARPVGAAAPMLPEVQSLEEPLPGFVDGDLRLHDIVADAESARPRESAEHADISRILHERLRQLDPLKQFVVAMRNDIGDAAELGARLFREEAALSLARGRAIAAAAAKTDDLPARIRLIGAAEAAAPAAAPLPAAAEAEPAEEMALAV